MDPGPLDGQVAIVTGGARGIGRAIADRFAAAGAAVAVADRDLEGAEEAARAIAATGATALAVGVDIADIDSIGSMLETALERLGVPAVLVNNAGHARFAFALDMTEEEWDYTHSICTRGTFFVSQRVARLMAEAGYGRILNLSSMTAPLGHARYAAYSSAKGAIESLTRVLAVELGEYGITVNALAPGPVETEFARAALTPERRALRLTRMPVGRLGTPEEVADAALFLCRPDAEWITGTVLSIDGGYTAHGATELRAETTHPVNPKEKTA